MTIETNLERIATALESLVEVLSLEDKSPAPVQTPTVPDQNPIKKTPAPTPAPAPTVPAPAPTVPAPAPTPPPAPAAPAAFADQKAFMDYCMAKYKKLGPIRGGMIQQVLIDLGESSIMSLPAEKWAEFRAKVEML